MKIALLGGTGNLGEGLALRFAKLGHEIIIGSRKIEKAKQLASEYLEKVSKASITGMQNEDAAKECDMAVFTIPWEFAFDTAEKLKDYLKRKIVVSPLVPMKKVGDNFVYVRPEEGSAAQKLATILTESKVVAAYHAIPAKRFANLSEEFEWDVPVCGDSEAKEVVIELTEKISGLRALDAGDLSNAYLIESLTTLILNIMKRNKIGEIGISFR
ncbi:MAG: NADPH-dependent F420 reductase [Archaeoglobus sp.]|uniref:NADPH-dependent F420 reductase n=1 Tax=Archaeoglobus sp. TaxID=1872626 RepID=UPI001DBE69DE|nr:NADPH-dependent F420 reductase [Archaeoglobus sp.]MBO8181040.1 NADPH-dependent F420 reductase [Archaeoglobus sp.]